MNSQTKWHHTFIHCVEGQPTFEVRLERVSDSPGFAGFTGTDRTLHRDFDRNDVAAMKQAVVEQIATMFPGRTLRVIVKMSNDPHNETLEDWANGMVA